MGECDLIPLKCLKCGQEVLRADLEKHSCIEALSIRCAQLRVYERKLQGIAEALEPEAEGGQFQRCYQGHVLKHLKVPKQNRVDRYTDKPYAEQPDELFC